MLFAPAQEPTPCVRGGRVSRRSDHRGGCCKKCFLYVETWQQKLPIRSATCCAASRGRGGSGELPPAQRGALCPHTTVPYLMGSLGCSMGRFAQRNGWNSAEKRRGHKRRQMLCMGFEEPGRELAPGRKEPLSPGWGHGWGHGHVGVVEPLPGSAARCTHQGSRIGSAWPGTVHVLVTKRSGKFCCLQDERE